MCFIALVTASVRGFSTGAPTAACEGGNDLVPGHGFPSSTNPLPYEVDISNFIDQIYVPNQLYNSKSNVIVNPINNQYASYMQWVQLYSFCMCIVAC